MQAAARRGDRVGGAGADEDEGELGGGRVVADGAQQGEAVHRRHVDVADDDVDGRGAQQAEGVGAVAGAAHLEAGAAQEVGVDAEGDRAVVDQRARRGQHAAPARAGTATQSALRPAESSSWPRRMRARPSCRAATVSASTAMASASPAASASRSMPSAAVATGSRPTVAAAPRSSRACTAISASAVGASWPQARASGGAQHGEQMRAGLLGKGRAEGLGVGHVPGVGRRQAKLRPARQCGSSPVAAGGRDSSASEVIASAPRAASSSTSVASSCERA